MGLSHISTASITTATYKWTGAAALGNKVYAVPYDADNILVYDVDSGALSSISTIGIAAGRCCKWSAAVAVRNQIVGVPLNVDIMFIYDVDSGGLTQTRVAAISSGS